MNTQDKAREVIADAFIEGFGNSRAYDLADALLSDLTSAGLAVIAVHATKVSDTLIYEEGVHPEATNEVVSIESIKRQVRNEALEEAAAAIDLGLLYSEMKAHELLDGHTLMECATAIRSLKTDGGGK